MAFIAMAMERTMITKAIRWLFAWIDYVIYTLVSWLMQAIFDIAEFSFSQDIFDKLIDRVYLILGIFMFFKLTISLITYLVNPDKMNDKERGIGNLITRVIVVFVMLIMLPTAFSYLTKLQGPLIRTLPRLILGVSIDDEQNSMANNMQDEGTKISWSIYRAFFYNNPDCVGYDSSSDNDDVLEPTFDETEADDPLNAAVSNINKSCEVTNDGSMYQYEYTPIISTIAGGFICYTLLGLCIMVAIRMFKLIILQMIAPIPIISYVDPKSSKDGAFSTWLKTVTTTWLEVFIILGIMYFVVFIIDELLLSGASEFATKVGSLGWRRGIFFTVFVILGLFMFAKQAPKFIMDSLGIKSKGAFGKTLGLASAALGMGGAALASGRASYMASKTDSLPQKGLAFMKSIPAGLLGGITGVGAAGAAALSADKDQSKAAFDALQKRNATALAQGDAGSSAFGRGMSSFARIAFGDTPATIGKRKIANLEASKSALEAVKSRASGEMVKQDWTESIIGKKDANGHWQYFMKDVTGADVTGTINYKDFMARKNAAASSGLAEFEIRTSNGMKKISMADAERYQGLLLKGNEDDYISRTVSGGDHEDQYMVALATDAEAKTPGLKINGRDSVTNTIDTQTIAIIEAKRKNAVAEQDDRFSGSGK